MMSENFWFLKRCTLFEKLAPSQAARLERSARMRVFPRHSLIYSPTEPGQSVMIVAKGSVKIKDISPEGKETILAFIEEGEIFGELALFEEDARREYAEAASDCEIVVLPRQELLWLMGQCPDLTFSLTKLIGLRRRRVETRLRNILFLSSRDRMLRLLMELTEAHGDHWARRCDIRLPLTHQEIASLVGLTRETVTVVLGQLQTEGLIKIQKRRIVVLDTQVLAEHVNGNGVLLPNKSRRE